MNWYKKSITLKQQEEVDFLNYGVDKTSGFRVGDYVDYNDNVEDFHGEIIEIYPNKLTGEELARVRGFSFFKGSSGDSIESFRTSTLSKPQLRNLTVELTNVFAESVELLQRSGELRDVIKVNYPRLKAEA